MDKAKAKSWYDKMCDIVAKLPPTPQCHICGASTTRIMEFGKPGFRLRCDNGHWVQE